MYRLLALAVLVGIVGCGDDPVSTPTPEAPASFRLIQQRVFTPTCALSGCHVGTDAMAGLKLDSASAYDNLVGVMPTNDSARSQGLRRVFASKPDSSFLLMKLTGTLGPDHGSQMPLGGTPLAANTIEFIRRWIAAGAPRTGAVVADTSLIPAP